jgi:basic membrane protein A
VVPGYLFAESIFQVAEMNSDVYFVGLDISEGDVLAVAETAGKSNWKLPPNCFCAVYEEHLSGFMAGYAAVKEGYKHLGFLGGIAVPPVTRFGFGFVQGADAAAKEMGIADQVAVEYIYGGQFYGDSIITAAMDSWYQQRGVEAIFACGGGIFTSACEAAAKVGKKVIGVDVDQTVQINKYGEGMHLTSAMKGLAATVTTVLTALYNDQWNRYSGKFESLGLTSPEVDDPNSPNFVQLPTEHWAMTNFTFDDYKALVADLYNGKYVVSNKTDAMPATEITVNQYPNIK